MSWILTFIAMPLLGGCSDQSIHATKDVEGVTGPAMEVSPQVINFGAVRDGETVADTFKIKSVGDEDLEVDGVELGIDNGSFSILTTDLTGVLPPGSEMVVEVAFTPLEDYQEGTAIVTSNASPSQATVDLVGWGEVPILEVTPDPYDFGETYAGCLKEQPLTLANVGGDTLEITDISTNGGTAFTYDLPAAGLPIQLEPGESVDVGMSFQPLDEDVFEGLVVVESNDPSGVKEAVQTGEGKFVAVYSEEFVVPVDPPTDIFFAVDTSCSMGDDQARLASNFDTFINELANYTTDWQLIVANGDDGCNDSGILTASTPNYESTFEWAVGRPGGAYTEALLTVAANGIENTDPGECNTGFMRTDALLHIILVSDEREQSRNSWSTYVDQIIAKKGNAALVKISAIAGDYPNGCGSADPGTGYYEAVNYTGGEFLSICDTNWALNMAQLAQASVVQDTYVLSYTPLESTIEVFVNGVAVPQSDWTYDASQNAVVFVNNIPEGGDTVRVDYGGAANCD